MLGRTSCTPDEVATARAAITLTRDEFERLATDFVDAVEAKFL